MGYITDQTSLKDALDIMSYGDKEIYEVLKCLIRRPRGYTDLRVLDNLNIRGPRIITFFTKCCDSNEGKIERTIAMFMEDDLFTAEEIQENVNSQNPIPFIDESKNPEGTPDYPNRMHFNTPLWYDFCQAQKEYFDIRMEKARTTIVKKTRKPRTKKEVNNVDVVVANLPTENIEIKENIASTVNSTLNKSNEAEVKNKTRRTRKVQEEKNKEITLN